MQEKPNQGSSSGSVDACERQRERQPKSEVCERLCILRQNLKTLTGERGKKRERERERKREKETETKIERKTEEEHH